MANISSIVSTLRVTKTSSIFYFIYLNLAMTDIYEKVATNLTDPGPINTELLARVDNANALTKYLSSRDLTLDNWRKLIVKIFLFSNILLNFSILFSNPFLVRSI